MRFGIHLPQFGRAASPDAITRAARHAEALGFDDVWVSDHIVQPATQNYPSPYLFDPLMTLAWAAAATERVAPLDDPDRNLRHLRDALGAAPARVVAMPVEDADLDAAAARYAAELPERFDLVHLGLGPDGHTASLVPGDPVLAVTDRLVAPTGGEYQGRRRMTLTYPALARAEQLVWLVTGADKRTPLTQLLAADPSIPAGRVSAAASLIIADREAAGTA